MGGIGPQGIFTTFNVIAIVFEHVASPHVKSSVPVALRA